MCGAFAAGEREVPAVREGGGKAKGWGRARCPRILPSEKKEAVKTTKEDEVPASDMTRLMSAVGKLCARLHRPTKHEAQLMSRGGQK